MKKREVILWIVIAISILLFLSNLGLGGMIGAAISRVFFGIFGVLSYILPILFVFAAFFIVANQGNKKALLKIISAVLLFLVATVLLEIIYYGESVSGPIEAFKNGYYEKRGGGFFGGLLASLLVKAFSIVGTVAVSVIVCIVSVISITGKNVLSTIFEDDKKKEREKRRKERERIRKERNETREIKKEEKKQRLLKEQEEKLNEIESFNPKEDEKQVFGFDIGAMDEIKLSQKDTLSDDDGFEYYPNDDSESHILSRHSLFPIGEDNSQEEPIVSDDNTEPVIEEPDAKETLLEESVKEEPAIEEPFEEPAIEEPTIEESVIEEPIVEEPIEEESVIEEPVIEEPVIEEPVTEESFTKGPVPEAIDEYILPTPSLLNEKKRDGKGNSKDSLEATAKKLETTLMNFGVDATVTEYSCGPAVTRFEITPKVGVKVSKILNLSDDIKLNLAAADIRIEAPIPGKSAVGIEVPNEKVEMVSFRELIESDYFTKVSSKIAFAAGRDIGGNVIVSDIAKMPHLLIAGATGSGKSVCINTIIMSILYKATPDEVKFIMIDPKVVELSVYNDIPHLLIPVVSDPKKAAGALHWAVHEMMERYDKFAQFGVRDMKGYNDKVEDKSDKLPQIVVIVDELADLMMVASSEVEEAICRLAQLARAASIHLIIATQRPSVNVITGLIKANMPSRIAFAVTSGVDSRTILDMVGAEKLLGKGDMLYYPQGLPKPLRVQGAFITDDEIAKVVSFIKDQNKNDSYSSEIEQHIETSLNTTVDISDGDDGFDDERDPYFERAARICIENEKGSIGKLQRALKIGFNRAARIMDQLEEAQIVGPEEGTKPRKVLVSEDEFNSLMGLAGDIEE